MDPNTLITRIDQLVVAEVAGELVGLDVDGGQCYGFNATATDIWTMLETPQTFDALCEALTATHEVDADTCREQTAAVIAQMASERLVALTLV